MEGSASHFLRPTSHGSCESMDNCGVTLNQSDASTEQSRIFHMQQYNTINQGYYIEFRRYRTSTPPLATYESNSGYPSLLSRIQQEIPVTYKTLGAQRLRKCVGVLAFRRYMFYPYPASLY